MKYAILFGGSAKIEFDNPSDFSLILSKSEGVHAVQKSDENQTVTLKVGDDTLDEAIRNDVNALAVELLKEPAATETVATEGAASADTPVT